MQAQCRRACNAGCGEERTDCKSPSPAVMGKKSCKASEKLLGQHRHGIQPEHQAGVERVSCQQTAGWLCLFRSRERPSLIVIPSHGSICGQHGITANLCLGLEVVASVAESVSECPYHVWLSPARAVLTRGWEDDYTTVLPWTTAAVAQEMLTCFRFSLRI